MGSNLNKHIFIGLILYIYEWGQPIWPPSYCHYWEICIIWQSRHHDMKKIQKIFWNIIIIKEIFIKGTFMILQTLIMTLPFRNTRNTFKYLLQVCEILLDNKYMFHIWSLHLHLNNLFKTSKPMHKKFLKTCGQQFPDSAGI